MSPSTRHLVRVTRNGKAVNPKAIGDLFYRDLVRHEPACKEFVVEIDAAGADELKTREEYDVTVLATDI